MADLIKISANIPKPVKDWLDNECAITGVSQTTIIYMALKTYIDQQEVLKLSKLVK